MQDAHASDHHELGTPFMRSGRQFVRTQIPQGENQGFVCTLAQQLANRYEPRQFHASTGRYLLVKGIDRKTTGPVLIKCLVRHDLEARARLRDREGVTNQLRSLRKLLEAERRLLVMLRNSGCSAIPHPNDYVFDRNPQLEGPYPTEDLEEWTYEDEEMVSTEPYLILKAMTGMTLEEALRRAPEERLSETRSLRVVAQLAGILRLLHRPIPIRAGMTWQLIYQDLKPGNILLGDQDRVTLLNLDGCQLINRDTGLKLLPGTATAGYCPPECERPHAALTPAADIYTVGTTLFQMLTGRSPREFLSVGQGPGPARSVSLDLRLLEGSCQPALRDLVARCLAPDPATRLADAESLQQALDPLMRVP
jgi:serine/threonine protein kinase